MSCQDHPDSSVIDCPGCVANARAPSDPNCPDCLGSGWLDPFPDSVTSTSVAIPCPCWNTELTEPDAPEPDADGDGWLDGVPVIRAKFYGRRFKPGEVTAIVVHCGSSGRFTFGRYFANPVDRDRKTGELIYRKVSTHMGIDDDGTREQYVPYSNASWNCGVRNFSTLSFEGRGPASRGDRPPAFYEALKLTIGQWLELHPTIAAAYSHRYLCPRTRRDPGPGFDWRVFEGFGLAVFR